MHVLQWALWAVGATLQILVLSSLLRGPYKNFPFVFVYSLSLFLTTVVEVAALMEIGHFTPTTTRYYWANDAVRQLLLFCVVIHFIYKAMGASSRKKRVRGLLILGAILLTVASALIHREEDFSFWLTKVSRDLNFSAAILDLILWSLLISLTERDAGLLMVSGGLGVQFTGAAIGHSIRQLARASRSRAMVNTGNFILVLSHFLCLYVWWRAFRTAEATRRVPQNESSPNRWGKEDIS